MSFGSTGFMTLAGVIALVLGEKLGLTLMAVSLIQVPGQQEKNRHIEEGQEEASEATTFPSHDNK